MIRAAIGHSATSRDCFCMEPGIFRIRLRCAAGDLTRVILHVQDKYLPLQILDTRAQREMTLASSDGTLDCWMAELEMHVVCLRYWFEFQDREGRILYYGNYRFSERPFLHVDDMFDCPQTLREEECFRTPKWAENQVIYQIFPSRFASCRPVSPEQWYVSPISNRDDIHGDLRGIINRLEHLRELGADILYMTPIFRANSCHKYDTVDYYAIDPALGTAEDLKELVNRAHAMGIRVILDGVFNHTSPDFFAFADIRQKGKDSAFLDWYYIEGFPLRAARGEKPNYKTFSYFGGMPKLNLKNPEVARYVLDVALYWLREAGIDGWRLDVGDEVGHAFWRRFRQEIKSEFPEALIVGEVWHYAEDFLRGDEWDTVMNYPFYQNVLQLAAQDRIPVSEFAGNYCYPAGQLHPRVLPLLWNLTGSHDTPRLLNHCGGSKARMRLIAALQLLLPGMPMIYYGDEYAMEGEKDPDCRRGMVWDPDRQDSQMYEWYRQLIRVRKACPAMLEQCAKFRTEDDTGLLIRTAGGYLQVFHCAEGMLSIPELAGRVDLITGADFDGVLGPYAAAVFEKMDME